MKQRIIKIAAALLCAVMITAASVPALADYPSIAVAADYALVTGTASLNLRSGPGTEYEWLGSVAEGGWVLTTGESGNWYSVYLPDTQQTGYMSKNFLKKSNDSGSGGVTTVVVNNPKPTQFLNLRQYPSLNAPVLGIYYNGAAFRLISATGDGWYQVEGNGQTGYFRQEYVKVSGTAGGQTAYVKTPNGGKVNLRSAPTYHGSMVIQQIANGSAVSVILSSSKAGSFWKVQYQGTVGFIDSSFLSASGSAPVTPPVTPSYPSVKPATKGTAVVNNPKATQFLNLREQPSTNAKVIAQYKNGIKFEVIEPGEIWTKVYGSASGNIGYFMTKYLKLTGVSPSPTKQVQNGSSYVNLRSAPSKATGQVYVQVPSGATVTVLTPGDEWTQVRYGSRTGYMMTAFLK